MNLLAKTTNAQYFYPRSPCGERPAQVGNRGQCAGISIHALLAESDLLSIFTLPPFVRISIHALLAESDRPRQYSFDQRFAISIHALLAESD